MDSAVIVALVSSAGGVALAATTGLFAVLQVRAQRTTADPPPDPAPPDLGADEPLREQVQALVAALVQQQEVVEWWQDRARACEAREQARRITGSQPRAVLPPRKGTSSSPP